MYDVNDVIFEKYNEGKLSDDKCLDLLEACNNKEQDETKKKRRTEKLKLAAKIAAVAAIITALTILIKKAKDNGDQKVVTQLEANLEKTEKMKSRMDSLYDKFCTQGLSKTEINEMTKLNSEANIIRDESRKLFISRFGKNGPVLFKPSKNETKAHQLGNKAILNTLDINGAEQARRSIDPCGRGHG